MFTVVFTDFLALCLWKVKTVFFFQIELGVFLLMLSDPGASYSRCAYNARRNWRNKRQRSFGFFFIQMWIEMSSFLFLQTIKSFFVENVWVFTIFREIMLWFSFFLTRTSYVPHFVYSRLFELFFHWWISKFDAMVVNLNNKFYPKNEHIKTFVFKSHFLNKQLFQRKTTCWLRVIQPHCKERMTSNASFQLKLL